tara:strand:+ start:630 stop:869 length:240 start_codon:yes stop_codon:yes gene_type:complete
MTYLVISLPRGEEDLLTQLFLAEKRMEPAFSMSFEVKNGKTYRVWHVGVQDDWVESFVPKELKREWATESIEKEPFEEF